MTRAWTRGIAVGLLAFPLAACEVRVTDDLDGVGGIAGSLGVAGGGGSAGTGGSAGQGGSGGTGGGDAGGEPFPTPTCDPEPMDTGDACVQCLKAKCCTQWLACDDQTCADEWNDTAACVQDYDLPGEEELGMCISESTDTMIPQMNTRELLDCINVVETPADAGADTTQCGKECFGIDIFFFD